MVPAIVVVVHHMPFTNERLFVPNGLSKTIADPVAI